MTGRFVHLVRHGEAAGGALTETGRRQAAAVGARMASLPIAALHHGPLPRAAETARIVASHLPGVPVRESEVCGDYIPPVGDPAALPRVFRDFLAEVTEEEYAHGAALARAALATFARPSETETHDLIVTHAFTVGWFLRDALGAPEPRWLGQNASNCALTTILYRPGRPPALVAFNEASHLVI
ncbi:histidine phosphatase family protein [Catenuloplanes atrovinosus]|uniref:Phosphoglycerate mutase n=1 Tax=Catenuloplanes atrovinosus TaxID=137266 RepID=A0AAE3YJZ5_9ACTN|nr:histidine phosphatase family protein [Catenuloplanes atrovinosus]MDR7273676.1 putative phosphoglycerate mutase [Catenuloplanes atrovinosus]